MIMLLLHLVTSLLMLGLQLPIHLLISNLSPNPTSVDTPTSNSKVGCGLKDPLTHISPIVNPSESPSTSQSSLNKYTIEQLLL